jgi:hypothetical protein
VEKPFEQNKITFNMNIIHYFFLQTVQTPLKTLKKRGYVKNIIESRTQKSMESWSVAYFQHRLYFRWVELFILVFMDLSVLLCQNVIVTSDLSLILLTLVEKT